MFIIHTKTPNEECLRRIKVAMAAVAASQVAMAAIIGNGLRSMPL